MPSLFRSFIIEDGRMFLNPACNLNWQSDVQEGYTITYTGTAISIGHHVRWVQDGTYIYQVDGTLDLHQTFPLSFAGTDSYTFTYTNLYNPSQNCSKSYIDSTIGVIRTTRGGYCEH